MTEAFPKAMATSRAAERRRWERSMTATANSPKCCTRSWQRGTPAWSPMVRMQELWSIAMLDRALAAAGVLCVLTGADATAERLGAMTQRLLSIRFSARYAVIIRLERAIR